MKKLLLLALIIFCAAPSHVHALDALGDGTQWDDRPFIYENSTDGAQNITPASEGSICDIVEISGWTLYNGRRDGGSMADDLYALPVAEEDTLLLASDVVGIVPCGDSFVYYGIGSDGKYHWFVRKPGQEAQVLPLSWMVDVFYGDANGVWYASMQENGSQRIYNIGLDGKGKQRLGTVRGYIPGVLSDGSIILVSERFNKITAWKDGKTTTLYEVSKGERFRLVVTTQQEIWVVYDDWYGRVENGKILDRQQGIVRTSARSGLQLAMLVTDQMDATQCRVMLMNDVVGSYADLGSAPYDGLSTCLMLQTDHVVVLGNASTVLPIPVEASAWSVYEN